MTTTKQWQSMTKIQRARIYVQRYEWTRKDAKLHPEKYAKRAREYYAKNKKKVLKTVRRWQAANKDSINAYRRKQYSKNPEKYLQESKRWQAAHPENRQKWWKENRERMLPILRANTKRWRLKNLERHKEYCKRWTKANPEKVKAARARYKAKHL